MKRITTLLVLAAFLPLAAYAQGGAGGVTVGTQIFNPAAANYDLGLFTMGGFGYGVTAAGQRIGGFGQAFINISPDRSTAGGVGGILVGQELRAGPAILGATLLAGLGGMGSSFFPPYRGYFIGFGELTLDAGLTLTPWMLLSVYGGMQVAANFIPGRPFSDALFYSPVAGVRISWGSFRR